jgi:hypothetical protein
MTHWRTRATRAEADRAVMVDVLRGVDYSATLGLHDREDWDTLLASLPDHCAPRSRTQARA